MNNESSFDITNQESNPVQTVAPTKEDYDMLRATEKITALYCRLSVEDKDEKKNGKAEVKSLQQEIEEQERQADNLEQFIQRVKRNSSLTELTPYALRELVKAVYVEAPNKSSGKRKQKIHISYDLIGFIPVDVLLKAERV